MPSIKCGLMSIVLCRQSHDNGTQLFYKKYNMCINYITQEAFFYYHPHNKLFTPKTKLTGRSNGCLIFLFINFNIF